MRFSRRQCCKKLRLICAFRSLSLVQSYANRVFWPYKRYMSPRINSSLLARALHLFLAAVCKTGWLFLPQEPLPRQILCITRSGNQQNEGWGHRSWSTALVQRTTNDHYLTTKRTRECSLTHIRTLDFALSVKESNKYWYLQAIEVSAAKERGEGRRGQERRVWQRNGSGGEKVCADKKRDGAEVSGKTHPVLKSERAPTTRLFGECRCCSQP